MDPNLNKKGLIENFIRRENEKSITKRTQRQEMKAGFAELKNSISESTIRVWPMRIFTFQR